MPAKTRRSLSRSRKTTVASVRIYVLWHPGFEKGLELARHIYAWFRLENMEGIPVFFRTAPGLGMKEPPPIPKDCELNYVLPLVESHMVADPVWRGYVTGLVGREDVCLYPVALDTFAYRMPMAMRHLNFIRHDLDREPEPSREGLLSQLTEVLCRDLRARESAETTPAPRVKGRRSRSGLAQAVPNKIKLFLSHAKADGTEIPVCLKEYIQTQTQCETFFDETDIASGFDYEKILENAIRQESAGMVVVHGDKYAERPWCRREVRRFQQPLPEELRGSRSRRSAAYFVPPLVVVDSMSVEGVARSIPELGYAPCLRWAEGRERIIVSTLLREILLGLFYRRLVRGFPAKGTKFSLLVNRAPDPIRVQQLLNAHRKASKGTESEVARVLYPGYGLSQLETLGLKDVFPDIDFLSLSDALDATPSFKDFAGKVLRLGIGNATDIHAGGLDDEHNKELLIRLLRPLCQNHLSILYGGAMPEPGVRWGTDTYRLNFTEVCLNLLLSEQSSIQEAADSGSRARSGRSGARLYNLAVWPDSEKIQERTVAEWTDVCSFLRISWETARLTKPRDLPRPDPDLAADLSPTMEPRQRKAFLELKTSDIQLERDVAQARCLTYMRQKCCEGFLFPVPDGRKGKPVRRRVKPDAHLFIGGRLLSSSGVAPGLFEEILYVLENPKSRKGVFIVGAGHGAAGAVAKWLQETPPQRPVELTVKYHRDDTKEEGRKVCRLDDAMMEAATSPKSNEPPVVTLGSVLDRLWILVSETRPKLGLKKLLNNGLSEDENEELLDLETTYSRICQLVWKGLLKGQP